MLVFGFLSWVRFDFLRQGQCQRCLSSRQGCRSCLSVSSWGQDPSGGSALEFKCFKMKKGLGDSIPSHRAISLECWGSRGPASAPQNNILVFTLDTEKPLSGKETSAPSLRSPASRRPRRLTVQLLFGGLGCKIGVAGCRCAHFEFPGFHQLRHSNDNI